MLFEARLKAYTGITGRFFNLFLEPDIADILRESGTATLEKNIEADAYWGTGPDGQGENQMGKIWMKLRAELAR